MSAALLAVPSNFPIAPPTAAAATRSSACRWNARVVPLPVMGSELGGVRASVGGRKHVLWGICSLCAGRRFVASSSVSAVGINRMGCAGLSVSFGEGGVTGASSLQDVASPGGHELGQGGGAPAADPQRGALHAVAPGMLPPPIGSARIASGHICLSGTSHSDRGDHEEQCRQLAPMEGHCGGRDALKGRAGGSCRGVRRCSRVFALHRPAEQDPVRFQYRFSTPTSNNSRNVWTRQGRQGPRQGRR